MVCEANGQGETTWTRRRRVIDQTLAVALLIRRVHRQMNSYDRAIANGRPESARRLDDAHE